MQQACALDPGLPAYGFLDDPFVYDRRITRLSGRLIRLALAVRQELVSGTIERFLVSAHGPVNGILGTMLFTLINAIFSGILMLALAALVFGLPLAATAFLAIPVSLLSVVAFKPFTQMTPNHN